MGETTTSSQEEANIFKVGTTHEEIVKRDGPQLVGLLKEMKEGLDTVRSKVQALMEKVKENSFPTREGLWNPDCSWRRMMAPDAKESEDKDNPLQYKPNPDMIVSKIDQAAQDGKGLYRPPMIAPTSMDEGHSSKHKRTELRKEKEAVRQASHSSFLKEMMNDLEGKPEEVRTSGWHENRDFIREKAKLEERAHMEEENFIRVPYSKEEKKKIKQLKRARNGLLGLVDDFYHEVSGLLPAEAKESKKKKGSADVKGKKNFGKRKRMR